MKEKFFNVRYLFGKENVWKEIDSTIERRGKGYVVVADGVVVNTAQRLADYRQTLSESMFAICDSGWVPLYIKRIYGLEREQYCGAMIFNDIIAQRRHRMLFMGTNQATLNALQTELAKINPDVNDMTFYELPFLDVEDFDYKGIAQLIADDGADIIWVALGAPKQCYFMQRLLPFLDKGVMLGVGAVFNFFSGTAEKRAPEWMLRNHLEFVYRIFQNPKKQIRRCWWIVRTLPSMLRQESEKKRAADSVISTLNDYIKAIEASNHEAVNATSHKVTEAIHQYDESRCRDKMNEYWLTVIDRALVAHELTQQHNPKDGYLIKVLGKFIHTMISLLDPASPQCSSLIARTPSLKANE